MHALVTAKSNYMRPFTIFTFTPKSPGYSPLTGLFRSWTPAEKLQARPEQYASALAHEVRNPLTNINLAVEMLRRATGDVEREIYLNMIMRGSIRINDLVNDLLSYYRIAGTASELYPVHQLLDEVLAMAADRIHLKNVSVLKEYMTPDARIMINVPQVKIALTNIIVNAIEAMPAENGLLRLLTRSVNGKCMLEIEDNGGGIPAENLKNIFKPYVSGKPGGMGLGLSTSLDIFLSNHANIEVRSENGKGACFMVTFDKLPGQCIVPKPFVLLKDLPA